MRCLIVGLGVQGVKRRRVAGADFVAAVDPIHPEAAFRHIDEVPVDSYDAALVCTPDEPKLGLLDALLSRGKHVLVEKPLLASDPARLDRLEEMARANHCICYIAYNHRFEPHFVRMRELIASGDLGKIYRCRLFYGNGTARLVRESGWRDQGAGVLHDLGSHLLDTMVFWFGARRSDIRIVSVDRFENRAPDHVALVTEGASPRIEMEMSLVSWRNDFACDVLAERGSAHIRSLCKWGPSSFTQRKRLLPSGRPPEQETTLIADDPTWQAEYDHFKDLCARRVPADLGHDRWLNDVLSRLGREASEGGVR
jgi:predicted dehydrogenase